MFIPGDKIILKEREDIDKDGGIVSYYMKENPQSVEWLKSCAGKEGFITSVCGEALFIKFAEYNIHISIDDLLPLVYYSEYRRVPGDIAFPVDSNCNKTKRFSWADHI